MDIDEKHDPTDRLAAEGVCLRRGTGTNAGMRALHEVRGGVGRAPIEKLVVVLLIGILWLGIPVAHAQSAFAAGQDAIVQRSWLDDPDSSMTPQEALGREWTPFTGFLSRGFTASTTWLRLRVDPSAAGPGSFAGDRRLVLQIVPGHLDEVAVFRADRLHEAPALLGDRHVRDAPKRSAVDQVVLANADASFDVLLRIRSGSNHSVYPRVLRWDAAREFEARRVNLAIAYTVFTVMVIVWALSAWVGQRDRSVLLFIAHQLSALLAGASLIGALRFLDAPLLPPGALDVMGSVAIPLILITAVSFHARILRQLGGRALDVKLLQLLAWPALLALVMICSGWSRVGLVATQIMILGANLFGLFAACRVQRPVDDLANDSVIGGKPYLVSMYLIMVLGMLPQWLRVMGIAPAGLWSLGGYFASTITASMLLGNLLIVRARHEEERQRRAELAYQQSVQEAAGERARAADQSELVAMLAHELKTPLSTVSLALGMDEPSGDLKTRALRAVDSMRNVIDRCDQAARIDDALVQEDAGATLQSVALEEVMLEAISAQNDDERVAIDLPPDLPRCLGDRAMLRVICTNLIENALKYSPPDSSVRVVLAPLTANGRAGVSLRVSNAVGAAGKPDAAQLFEKFYRAPNARSRSGSGLGLYLSRRVAARMGAELTCDLSDPDAVSFQLWVPCTPSTAPEMK